MSNLANNKSEQIIFIILSSIGLFIVLLSLSSGNSIIFGYENYVLIQNWKKITTCIK
jgi:hypothetical protein